MKILTIILFAFVCYACTATSPAEPPPEQECIDYSGNAGWVLTDSTFAAVLLPGYDFTGNVSGSFMETDSGKVLTVVMTGTFTPALGDRKKYFIKTGSLLVQGIFNQRSDGEHETTLYVIFGTEELIGTTGHIYLSWYPKDKPEFIYYVGILCMVPNVVSE